jgi:hypothetical protein
MWLIAGLAGAVALVGVPCSLWFADAMRKTAGADPLFGPAIQLWLVAGSVLAAVIVGLALLEDSRRRLPPPQFFPPSLLPGEPPSGRPSGPSYSWRSEHWDRQF